MVRHESGITRRGFVQSIIASAVASTLAARHVRAEGARARIVRVESPDVWKGDARRPEVVAAMVNAGLMSFTGEAKADAAWRRFVKPGMRVGFKLNLLGRPLVITAREVTDAVVAGAVAAGVKPADITVWDRKAEHFGTTSYEPGTGRHGERIRIGAAYHDSIVADTSGGPVPIDRIPVEETDITVNLPVIKDHGGSGVTGALKNIAFGCYRNHRQAHSGNCDPYIAETCEHFFRTTKVPLIVLDATEGCFDGGPAPQNSQTLWRENAIYVATDPVALDVVLRDVILAKRRAVGLPDKLRQCRHIETAAAKGLGVGDPALIDVVTVKV
jgi:uncharacterized protein (DUF362 family)